MKLNRPRRQGWLVGAMLLATVAGCKTPLSSKVPIDTTAGMFDSAKIDYSVDVAKLGEPMSVARVEGRAVSYEAQPTVPQPGAAKGRLTITYPSPQSPPGYARCRVTLESLPNGARGGEMLPAFLSENSAKRREQQMFEVWTLDIPKADLDRAVGKLGESGFFRKTSNAGRGVKISTTIDGAEFGRSWQQIPELDALMLRVRTEGKLEEYHRPVTTSQRGEGDSFASVSAYRSQQIPLPIDPSKVVSGATSLVSAATGYGLSHNELSQTPPAEPVPALNYAPAGAIGSIPPPGATPHATIGAQPQRPATTAAANQTVAQGFGSGTFKTPAAKTAWRWPWQANTAR